MRVCYCSPLLQTHAVDVACHYNGIMSLFLLFLIVVAYHYYGLVLLFLHYDIADSRGGCCSPLISPECLLLLSVPARRSSCNICYDAITD